MFSPQTRHDTWLKKTSSAHSYSHGSEACVSSMEARLAALVDRLRQTEEVLVAERLARQTAEAAQQAVGPTGPVGERTPVPQSLIDTRAIAKPPLFNGDIDPNGQPEGMPWSQWSFIFRSYIGSFDPGATQLLQRVERKWRSQHCLATRP